MRTRCIGFYLAVVLPAFAAAPGNGKHDWGRLAQITKSQVVKVHLRDGRTLTGNVLEYQPNGLSFLDERRVTRIDRRRITGASVSEAGQVRKVQGSPQLQPGQLVELSLSDGRVLSGRVRDAHEDSLTLFQPGAAEQIAREDVVSVTKNGNRATHTLIGMGIGFGIGAALGVRNASDKSRQGEAAVVGGLIGAPFGALVGAVLPVKGPLYEVVKR